MKLNLTVNGQPHRLDVEPLTRLIDLLREDLRLTGTKEGCGEGECGACTVLVDGQPLNACLVPACQLEGARVLTIEGLRRADGSLDPVQQAFIDGGAVQCGFCIPGMVLSVRSLLDRCPQPTEREVRTAISGNLCRCTGYTRILEAAQRAAELGKGKARDEGADEPGSTSAKNRAEGGSR